MSLADLTELGLSFMAFTSVIAMWIIFPVLIWILIKAGKNL